MAELTIWFLALPYETQWAVAGFSVLIGVGVSQFLRGFERRWQAERLQAKRDLLKSLEDYGLDPLIDAGVIRCKKCHLIHEWKKGYSCPKP